MASSFSQYYSLLKHKGGQLRSHYDAERAEKFQEELQEDYQRELERERKQKMKEGAK